ncbi:MAG: lipopolysaccharide heptosyltransferase II [Deltaproteobacteria bacterium]|nr:lipopolysaccharide heptosyltransferase II [Deltaproteobacteria bacterium]
MTNGLPPTGIEKILVRLPNWIGDAVMSTPALGAVRAFFPQAEITVAAPPAVAELFRSHPYCDRIVVLGQGSAFPGLARWWAAAQALRRQRFDLAILFQNAISAAFLATLARCRRRIGYVTDGRGFLLTHRAPTPDRGRRLHQVHYYLEMLKHFGIGDGKPILKLECTAEEREWARNRLGQGQWIAINPGAAYGEAKRWFPERFAQVADGLAREFGCGILLTGGPGEIRIGSDIEAAMESRPLNLIGQTTVRQLMALLSQSSLMITNDSGPMHIAAAFGVPLVAIFGPTDHLTTSPWTDRAEIIREDFPCAPCLKRKCPIDHRCMKAVSAEKVLEKSRLLLAAPAGN